MSTAIKVDAHVLRTYLLDIQPLFTDITLPVLFEVNSNKLQIICNSGCYYHASMPVVAPDTYASTVILYRDIVNYLPTTGSLLLDITSTYLYISSSEFEITLPTGYSEITPITLPDVEFHDVSSGYTDGLKALKTLGLSRVFLKDAPVELYGDVAVMSYPNMRIQVRTPGLGLQSIMDMSHVNLLVGFKPTSMYCNGVDEVILRRNDATLCLQIKPVVNSNNFLDFMQQLSQPITVTLDKHSDKVRSMLKLNSKALARLTLFEKGFTFSVNSDNTLLKTIVGDISSAPCKMFQVPIVIWNAMIKTAGSGTVQLLYGGNILCMRTASIIMIVRALS